MKKSTFQAYFKIRGNVKHNPDYKLAEVSKFNGKSFLDIVYGIANDGTNEGLEIYYKHEENGHFYTSRRYLSTEIPKVMLKISAVLALRGISK